MPLHDLKNFLNKRATLKQTRVNFLPRKYDVISHLHHSYAKDSFCVIRLKCQIVCIVYKSFKITILGNKKKYLDFDGNHPEALLSIDVDLIYHKYEKTDALWLWQKLQCTTIDPRSLETR